MPGIDNPTLNSDLVSPDPSSAGLLLFFSPQNPAAEGQGDPWCSMHLGEGLFFYRGSLSDL